MFWLRHPRLLLVLAHVRWHVMAGIPVTPRERVLRKREHTAIALKSMTIAGRMRCVFMEGA